MFACSMFSDAAGPIRMRVPISVAIVCSLLSLAAPANAQITKTCAGVEVRSIEVSADEDRKALPDATPADIKILPAQVMATTPGAPDKTVTVIALGPGLGSMDSEKVKTDLACTDKGLILTATITRFANYPEATLGTTLKARYPWRPRITIVFALRQPEIVLQITWRMRLTTGAELGHAKAPTYPEQEYPITVTKTVRSASGQEQ
jgi:hypothetical protein